VTDKPVILYVDDERGNLVALKYLLMDSYEVLTAESGAQGLELLSQRPDIQLLISDQRMPGMSGVELLERSFELRPEVIRILVTAYTDSDAIVDAINRGRIYHYFSKPWDDRELLQVLARALEQQRLEHYNQKLLERLTASEQRLGATIRHGGFAIIEASLDGTLLDANEAGQRMLGVQRERLIGRSFTEFTHPDDREGNRILVQGLVEGELPKVSVEKRYLHPDGTEVWAWSTVTLVRDEDGQPSHLAVMGTDITERKRAEQARAVAEARQRAIGEAIPDLLMVLDEDGRYVEILTSRESLLYRDSQQVLGRTLAEVFEPAEAERFHRVVLDTIATNETQVIEYSLDVGAGCLWFEGHTALMKLREGDKRLVLFAARDITARKQAQDELARHRDQLEELVALRTASIEQANSSLRAQERRAELLRAVSSAANQAETVGQALQAALHAVCSYTGWPLGFVFLPRDDGGEEGRAFVCHDVSGGHSRCDGCSIRARIARGQAHDDLLATVLTTREPSWSLDSAEDLPASCMRDAAARVTAYALPVVVGDEVAAVLQFHEPGYRPADQAMMDLLARVGEQLAPVIARKRAERALREREEQYRALVEGTTDWIWEVDAQGRYTYASPQVRDMLGHEPAEVLGRTPFDFMPPAEAERVGAVFGEIVSVARPFHGLVNRNLRRDGQEVIIETSGTPLFDGQGELRGYRGIDRDVTQRHRAEQRLRHLFRAIEQSPAIVVITNARGIIEYVNPRFTQVTGYSADEILGHNPGILNAGVLPADHYRELWSTLLGGRMWQGELCNRKKSGEVYWEQASISAVRDEGGAITHFVGVKEDVTDKRAAAEELRQAKEAAEAASRAKSIFLANMSHEIRTPMNAILGFSQLMARDPDLRGRQAEHLGTITRAGEHLLALINDVLEMSKIEAGRLELQPADFDLATLVGDLRAMFQYRAKDRDLQLLVELAPDVPVWVHGDQGKLRQVFINLMSNAVKFTEAGGVAVRVGGGPDSDGAWRLLVEVEDSGPGIPAEDLEHIFRQFEQSRLRSTEGGTGLGLAISRRFVELMGGTLSVRSELGRGSVFRFDVLLGPPLAAMDALVAPEREVLGLAPGTQLPRVLVADDRKDNRKLIQELLGRLGFQVFEVADGQQAVEAFETLQPDLVLMDMGMPVMDGYEAVRRIRALPGGGDVPILAVTASVFSEDLARVTQAGANGMLRKPFREPELLELIRQALQLEYRYPSDATAPDADEERPLVPATLEDVPDALRKDLITAALAADPDKLTRLVRSSAALDQASAALLIQLAEAYDYESIIALLESQGDKE
jgi:PAS domain S-box-containing protein